MTWTAQNDEDIVVTNESDYFLPTVIIKTTCGGCNQPKVGIKPTAICHITSYVGPTIWVCFKCWGCMNTYLEDHFGHVESHILITYLEDHFVHI